VKEIKDQLVALSEAQRAEVSAFLFHLRHAADPEYQKTVQRRMEDKDPAHWLTADEIEKRLRAK
jgi:hypothetical protein